MTEKQGGSDVRANTTRAEPIGDGEYELTGHKWFCSYPSADVFLVLAQAPAGLSCFLAERGPGFELQRLKDKLGTRSLPSSEVEFRGLRARLVGEEGRACRRSSRWSTTRGSTASSARPPACAARCRRRCTTPVTGRPSGRRSPTTPP